MEHKKARKANSFPDPEPESEHQPLGDDPAAAHRIEQLLEELCRLEQQKKAVQSQLDELILGVKPEELPPLDPAHEALCSALADQLWAATDPDEIRRLQDRLFKIASLLANAHR
jgi:hypothetical protein